MSHIPHLELYLGKFISPVSSYKRSASLLVLYTQICSGSTFWYI